MFDRYCLIVKSIFAKILVYIHSYIATFLLNMLIDFYTVSTLYQCTVIWFTVAAALRLKNLKLLRKAFRYS